MAFDTAGIVVSAEDQVRCVEREITFRQRVCERRVNNGQMTVLKARHEIAAMEAVLETVRKAAAGDRLL